MNQAEIILYSLQVWMIIGALIAVVFLTVGIDRFDEVAIPSIMVAGLSVRQQWPTDFTPQKIAPAEQEQAQ